MNARILLVEDDERLADLTAEYLRKNDYTVDIEGHGDTAEKRILDTRPDLVVLDVMLPGQDGFAVCRAVRPEYEGIILMLTARDEDIDQILGLELGADDYITKPVPPRLLLARIKALLRRATPAAGDDSQEASDSAISASASRRAVQAWPVKRLISPLPNSICSGCSPATPAAFFPATTCCCNCAASASTASTARSTPASLVCEGS